MYLFISVFIPVSFSGTNVAAQSLWTRENSGTTADLYGVYFLNDSIGYAVGDSGTILRTRDAGGTWSKSSLGNITLRAVQFLDSTTGYVVGYGDSGGVILKTTDAGDNWDTITTKASGLCLAEHFMNKDTGLVVGYGHFIVKTTDGGKTWLDLSSVVGTSIFINDIDFLNDSVGFLAAGDCGPGFPCPPATDYLGQIKKTTDGGNTWSGFATFGSFSAVSFGSDSVGLASLSSWSYFYRSGDGGTTWSIQRTNLFPALYTGEIWRLDFLSTDTGWAVGTPDSSGSAGLVASTVDGGRNWKVEDSITTGTLHDIFFSNRRDAWVVGAKGAVLRRDGFTSVESPHNIPAIFSLGQNYPNPFNPSTTITFQLSTTSQVTLKIYDLLGRGVKTLVDDVEETAGQHAVIWDGTGHDGRQVASGVYFYRLTTPNGSITNKAVLIR